VQSQNGGALVQISGNVTTAGTYAMALELTGGITVSVNAPRVAGEDQSTYAGS
jgi:hypothetical protein